VERKKDFEIMSQESNVKSGAAVAGAAPCSASPASKITVAGVTFGADEVVSAVVKLDGREIHISKKEDEPRKIGFVQ
jgi:hypothetical protein